ncbi:MAG TPA: S8 family peptidase [Anaerolineae bacterium]|nr:S8 family peptidase [Anaerolineae bacterium]
MKRHLLRAILLALLLWPTALYSQDPFQGEEDPQGNLLHHPASVPSYRPGQILVKFREQTPPQDQVEALGAHNLPVLEVLPDLLVQRVAVPEGQEQMVIQALSEDPRVEYAELDYVVHATIIPNDYYYDWQWGLAKIQAPAAWDQTTGTSDLIIAIVDTGVDLNHPDLNDKIVPGWDFVNDDKSAQDDHGHGTHVAGIAAAETNNSQGVAGVSWGARILPVKVLDGNGDGYYSDVARGVRFACDHGAKIINLSLGGDNPSSTLKDALEQVYQDGCLIMAAAGNGGGNGVDYPAKYVQAIAVAATDRTDQRASFSDYGPEIDVAAPGVEIWSTLWPHTYDWKQGTSMSTPYVAGLAALLWSVCPELSNTEVRSVIESTAKDLGPTGWDSYYGHGRIDAEKAIEYAGPPPTLTVSTHQMLFLADATWGPWPQTLIVGNDAPCRSLDWSAGVSEDWLEAHPDAGQASSSQPGEFVTTVITSGLSTGNTYYATVTLNSSTLGVQESPQEIGVKFVYSDTPLLRTFLPLSSAD